MSVQTQLGPNDGIPIGSDCVFRVLCTDTGDEHGDAQSLTGKATRFVLQAPGSSDNLVDKTSGASQIAYTNVNGTADAADVTLLDDDTSGLQPGVYDWALWRTDSNQTRPLAWGTVELLRTAKP